MNNVTSSLDIEIGAGSLDDDSPKDECGVLGISTPHGEGVAQLAQGGEGPLHLCID